jgi:DNA-binding NtrC family response regulator
MMRVLFVDDDPNILQGLQRSLRSMRREWEMSFASGPHEAVTLFDQAPCDVVVSDMRLDDEQDVLSAVQRTLQAHQHLSR